MQHIKSYFLAPYLEGTSRNRAKRKIKGILHVVERYNHGLAHGLRQGALAKDILEALVCLNESKDQGVKDFYAWASERIQDKNFIKKLELASAFQRSGRQSEVSSAANLELYKKFERQDALNFRIAAQKTGLFKDLQEIKIFEEAILWSNKGELDENQLTDLKYIRRILHCAHTFDLRRLTSFCGNRIQQDAMDQLFGKRVDLSDGSPYEKLSTVLWKRSGEYLKATGDRDLVDKRPLENSFFTQSKHPIRLVLAIEAVKARLINPNYRRTQNSDASPAGFRTNVQ